MNLARLASGLASSKLAAILGGATGFVDIQNWYSLANITTTLCGSAYQNTFVGKIKDNSSKSVARLLVIPIFVLPLILILVPLLFSHYSIANLTVLMVALAVGGLSSILNTLWVAEKIAKEQQSKYAIMSIAHAVLFLLALSFVFLSKSPFWLLVIFALSQMLWSSMIFVWDGSFFRSLHYVEILPLEFRESISYIALVGMPAVLGLFTVVGLRLYIETSVSIDEAHLWTSLKKLGEIHLSFYLILISMYIVPTLKNITIVSFLGKILVLLCFFFSSSFILIFFAELVIFAVYSSEFVFIREYLWVQCLSDGLSLLNVLFGTMLLVNDLRKRYFFIELLSTVLIFAVFYVLLDSSPGSSVFTYMFGNVIVTLFFASLTFVSIRNR